MYFSVYDHSGDSGQEFHTNVHTLFDCMGHLLASNSDNIKSNQVTFTSNQVTLTLCFLFYEIEG